MNETKSLIQRIIIFLFFFLAGNTAKSSNMDYETLTSTYDNYPSFIIDYNKIIDDTNKDRLIKHDYFVCQLNADRKCSVPSTSSIAKLECIIPITDCVINPRITADDLLGREAHVSFYFRPVGIVMLMYVEFW
jgi:hypothetical protein